MVYIGVDPDPYTDMKYQAIQLNDVDLELTSIGRVIPEGGRLLYVIEAPTLEEAMTEHHRRQGFEPYRPEGPTAPCVRCGALYYPEGSGDCGPCGSVKVEPLSEQEVEGLVSTARWGLANGITWDEYSSKTIIALGEELLALRTAHGQ